MRSYNSSYEPQPIQVVVNDGLGSISVFISSFLLSFGAFISIVLTNLRKSNCQTIKMCGCHIKRTNLNIEDEVVV